MIINGGKYYKCDEVLNIAIDCMKNRAYSVLTDNLEISQVDIKPDEIIKGMTIISCQNIFDISNPHSIIE